MEDIVEIASKLTVLQYAGLITWNLLMGLINSLFINHPADINFPLCILQMYGIQASPYKSYKPYNNMYFFFIPSNTNHRSIS